MNSLKLVLNKFKEEKLSLEEASTLIEDIFNSKTQNILWNLYPQYDPYKYPHVTYNNGILEL